MTRKSREDIVFNDFANIAINRATASLQRVFLKETLEPENISIQEWRALLNLSRFGDCHLRELSRLASMDASNTSKAAAILEERGLIVRYDDKNDSRRKRLAVTDKGDALVDRVWAQALALDQRAKDRLGKTKYNALKASLAILQEFGKAALEELDSVQTAA